MPSITFSQIPYSNNDIVSPFRGIEMWNNAYAVPVPPGNSSNILDEYYRFAWFDIETVNANSYNWTVFDREIQGAIENKRKFNFGIMPLFMNWNGVGNSPGGATLSYPVYLHNQMQAESTKDWIYSGSWVINWNSPSFLKAWENLLRAVANRINTTSYKGIPYKNAVGYVDIRSYGDFGEWHTYPWTNTEPSGTKATVATLKKLIDLHIEIFPDNPLVIVANAYDPGNASRIPAEVSYYALTASNRWGKIGWRRDNWGDPGTDVMLVNNSASFNGVALKTLIMDQWKFAPIVGEPLNTQSTVTGSCGSMYCDLERQIRLYHASSFGNGNYPNTNNSTMRTNIVNSSKAAGYRLLTVSGSLDATPGKLSISLNWQNVGIAPIYENWDVNFILKSTTTSTVKSSFKLKGFLPQSTPTTNSESFTVAAGTYSVSLQIIDPLGYRKPLQLAISGIQSDGSYLLGNITVPTDVVIPNSPPTVSAGANVTLTLPKSSATLTGSASDGDGTINSVLWTKISGGPVNIVSPTSAVTDITGFSEGNYIFRLTATDDKGATASDDVSLVVNPAPNQLPIARAGADVSLTLPNNTVILDGGQSSDPDGTILAYTWTKDGSLVSISSSITITNLTEGTHQYTLTVVDNKGAQSSDNVTVTVLPAPYNYILKDGITSELEIPFTAFTIEDKYGVVLTSIEPIGDNHKITIIK